MLHRHKQKSRLYAARLHGPRYPLEGCAGGRATQEAKTEGTAFERTGMYLQRVCSPVYVDVFRNKITHLRTAI